MLEDHAKIDAIPPPPNAGATLSDEQMSQLYRLTELDPEVTRRLARALDRLQTARPYQPTVVANPASNPEKADELPPLTHLSPEERSAHEAFVMKELSTLLMLAGQLNHTYEVQPQANPDVRFKNVLKAEILRQASTRKPSKDT